MLKFVIKYQKAFGQVCLIYESELIEYILLAWMMPDAAFIGC
jgi:hypothetical protein